MTEPDLPTGGNDSDDRRRSGPKERHKRRRRRATAEQGAPAARPDSAPDVDPVPPKPSPRAPESEPAPSATSEQPIRDPRAGAHPPANRRRRTAPRDPTERGLHDLVGSGHTQLSASAALRARDLYRPTEDDLHAAETEVVVVHRHWRPDTDGATRR